MPDFDLITTTLAARYAPGAVTPPAGLVNVRSSTGDLPNKLGALPAVLVFPDEGTFATGNGTRTGAHTFRVRFYLSVTTDLTRELVRLRKWVTVLVDQLKLAAQLGGVVTVARVTSWRIGLLDYDRRRFSGVELVVTIVTDEPWPAVA